MHGAAVWCSALLACEGPRAVGALEFGRTWRNGIVDAGDLPCDVIAGALDL